MNISSSWREQHDRMRRSHTALMERATGQVSVGSDEARDALYHFFQDAYHLKDWLKNDSTRPVNGVQLENDITSTPELALCADLCNGTKHFGLNRSARTGDSSTGFDSQSVNIFAPAAGASQASGYAAHSWTVTSGGSTLDALKLADDVVAAWDNLLRAKGLLP
jgi:hypothetical protein